MKSDRTHENSINGSYTADQPASLTLIDFEFAENVNEQILTTPAAAASSSSSSSSSHQQDTQNTLSKRLARKLNAKEKERQRNEQNSEQKALSKRPKHIEYNPDKNNDYSSDKKDIYQTLEAEFLEAPEPTSDQITNLGIISQSQDEYFLPTKETQADVATFLNEFWRNSENRERTKTYQKRKPLVGEKPAHPTCMSFLAVTLNGKRVCFVAISSFINCDKDLTNALEEFTNAFTTQNKSGTEFVFTKGDPTNFGILLNRIRAGNDLRIRTCAEKTLCLVAAKLFLKHKDMRVQGMVNVSFFPFSTQNKEEQDKIVKKPDENNPPLPLNDNLFVPQIGCCNACKSYKHVILKMLVTVQQANLRNNGRARLRFSGEESNIPVVWLTRFGLIARIATSNHANNSTNENQQELQHEKRLE